MKHYFWTLCISTFALAGLCLAYAGPTGHDESQAKKLLREGGNQMEEKRKVVFHVDWEQEERLLMALENTKNLFKEIPPQQCSVQMVANGKAVNLFRKDKAAKYAKEMEDLNKLGVSFKACRNAIPVNRGGRCRRSSNNLLIRQSVG